MNQNEFKKRTKEIVLSFDVCLAQTNYNNFASFKGESSGLFFDFVFILGRHSVRVEIEIAGERFNNSVHLDKCYSFEEFSVENVTRDIHKEIEDHIEAASVFLESLKTLSK